MSLHDDLLALAKPGEVPRREPKRKLPTMGMSSKVFAKNISVGTLSPGEPSFTKAFSSKSGLVESDSPIDEDSLERLGLSPDEWRVTRIQNTCWGPPDRQQESVRVSVERKALPPHLEELVSHEALDRLAQSVASESATRPVMHDLSGTKIIALGDMQFGKIDGAGVEAATHVAFSIAANAVRSAMNEVEAPEHLLIAFLGDHVEGFTSQGGQNAWRTQLPLTHQVRLFRRLVLMIMEMCRTISPATRLTFAAVPGNHGRIATSGGLTIYSDSHDTESLVAISDALKSAGALPRNVEFFVPSGDEISLAIPLGSGGVLLTHGDQFKDGGAIDWWKGQAFGDEAFASCNLLLTGHYHSTSLDEWGHRTHVRVSAMELASEWWRHKTGTTGYPSCLVIDYDGEFVSLRRVKPSVDLSTYGG